MMLMTGVRKKIKDESYNIYILNINKNNLLSVKI
jgi:hypothetical protein